MQREKNIEQLIDNMGRFFHSLRRGSPQDVHAKLHRSRFMSSITRTQIGIMIIVAQSDGISVKTLAQKSGISPSAATQLVDGLVQKGLLIRKTDPQDRRRISLSLSEKGRKKLKQGKEMHVKRFSQMLNVLTDEELETLVKIQQKIITSLQAHNYEKES